MYQTTKVAPIGHMTAIRIPQQFMVERGAAFSMAPMCSLGVQTYRTPMGAWWRVAEPLAWARKGWAEPKWRQLFAEAP